MNYITLTLGILALGYGIFSCIARFVKPEWFSKLEPMKKTWGKVFGNILHFASYVIVPLAVGVCFIIMGINGVALF